MRTEDSSESTEMGDENNGGETTGIEPLDAMFAELAVNDSSLVGPKKGR
jgi:hypothetical protein